MEIPSMRYTVTNVINNTSVPLPLPPSPFPSPSHSDPTQSPDRMESVASGFSDIPHNKSLGWRRSQPKRKKKKTTGNLLDLVRFNPLD